MIKSHRARQYWPILFVVLSLGAVPALAAQPEVKTVPWVATNPLIPHTAFDGEAHTLKGTNNLTGANFAWTWDFGDGSPVAAGTVTNQYAIEASHAYSGAVGTIFTATLTVEDTNTGEIDSENYFVQIQDKNLETEANAAIDEGLWYLHKTMDRNGDAVTGDGEWDNSTSCGPRCASGFDDPVTASNITAFFVNGHLETGAATSPYTETVQRSMRWLMTVIRPRAIGTQAYPAPIGTVDPDFPYDGSGNGIGIEPVNRDPGYAGGQTMDAIVASGTPAAIATTGPANVTGRTYGDIIQDMVDMYAWGQGNSGTYFGGWHYNWNSPSSDNSTNQWAAIGLMAAERAFGATVPDWIKEANENSIFRTQQVGGVNDGQFGYTNSPNPIWGPYATAPSGMVQMAMDGIGRGDARWDRSEEFMRTRFCNVGGAGNAIRDYYYGMFSFTKSMLLHDSDGDGNSEPLTILGQNGDPTMNIDWYAAEAAAGDACDGVARTLINDQNPAGYWYAHNFSGSQYAFETAWAIIMLNRTVFDSGLPVAVATANPNPAVAGAVITLDGSTSFHQDSERTIVSWMWDLDDDGVFDVSGPSTTTSFPAVGVYPVTLKVCDDATPEVCDDTIVQINVALPPLAPTADANGPYVFCSANTPWFLDGTGSTNPDEGVSEPGQPGDTIQAYDWELDGDNAFDDAAGAQPDVTAFYMGLGVGNYIAQLRVTDTSATSFPTSQVGDLSDVGSAQISVKDDNDPACACIDDLTSRPKLGKIQLVWSDSAPAGGYNVYRSNVSGGPYSFIANTTNSYSTYLDTGLQNGTEYFYVVRPAALNGDELCQSNETSATPIAAKDRLGAR